MNKEEILNIANEAYPKIVKYFGKVNVPNKKIEKDLNNYLKKVQSKVPL